MADLRRILLYVCAALAAALAVPAAAAAATVVNGDFEAGTLRGWVGHRTVEAGNWFAYRGTSTPISDQRGDHQVQRPPQGSFAAITDELAHDTLTLYQDVALEPGRRHHLSLFAYYDSSAPIAVPTPDTLSVDEALLGGQRNQQFRIDVVRPEAPLDTLDPAAVLATVFQTRPGSPRRMTPTRFEADLSAFAGQTVRLRIVNAVGEDLFNAGVDAVSISSDRRGGGGDGGPGGALDRSRLALLTARPSESGAVALRVWLPQAGLLTARDRRRGKLRQRSWKFGRARVATVRVRPSAQARRLLKRRGKVRTRVTLLHEAADGGRERLSRTLAFRLKNS